ncbi:hypothetical protein ABMA28_012735 [Loxostege sticticalis]|uniref:C2H2-type domain-containing protein n=1 Tax=Loxostege sticticalis TaxID=481309 RepID=A0ABD0S4W0_LOXSC
MSSESGTFAFGVQYLVCECGEALSDEASLRAHLAQAHPQRRLKLLTVGTKNAPPPVTEFRCGECGNIYSTEEECVSHQETEHLPYMEEGDYEVVTEEDVEDVIVPGVIFPRQSSPTPSDCSIPPEVPKKKKKRNNRRDAQCETCGKKLTSNAMIWVHRKLHSGVKDYKCTYCPKAFALPMYLESHIRTHTGEKPYQCQKCPRAFSTQGNLLRHDLVHTGIKPYQCPACGNCFKQSNSMKLHYHTVHLKLPTPYLSKKRRARLEARENKPNQLLPTPYLSKKRRARLEARENKPNQLVKEETQQSNSMKLHYHTVHLKLPTPYLSKKRRARLEAREHKPNQLVKEETQEQLSETHSYTDSGNTAGDDVIYVKTAAGREIALSTIVPKKMRQQALLQAKTEVPTEEFGIKEEEVYSDDVPAENEEEVAYEVVIGQFGSMRQF